MDFNDLFILECFEHEEDRDFFYMHTIPSLEDFNISSRFQFLKKNEYLVEDPNDTSRIILSVKGNDLLQGIRLPDPLHDEKNKVTYTPIIMSMSKTPDECFEEWWKKFPTSATWNSEDGATKFVGSRTLKNITKAKAKERYLKLLNQGLKHEELLGALLYEIKLKKVDSIKKGENQMDYFKGMESYFNSERYLNYIDNYKDNPSYVQDEGKVKGKRRNVTDI
jgi:hypothetical protein